MTELEQCALSLCEPARYFALEAASFEARYQKFPHALGDEEFRGLIAPLSPDAQSDILSEVQLVDRTRQLDQGWFGARAIWALVLTHCAREEWQAGDKLDDLRDGDEWQLFWSTLVHRERKLPLVEKLMPKISWWVKAGAAGHNAGLTSPSLLSAILKEVDFQAMGEKLEAEGRDPQDLPPLAEFLRKAADAGRWVFAIEAV